MKNFYIITNEGKDPEQKITLEVQGIIEKLGGKAIIAEKYNHKNEIPEDTECVLSLGGDGTLIRTAGALHQTDIPMIGINLGTLGYLTEIELANIKDDIKSLMTGMPFVEERMMIEGELESGERNIALNDIVLTREGALRTIRFRIYVNGAFLHSYKADGIILSTPTGSTGYSLSAGGPIVEPTASLFILTPICPHSLNKNSIILSADDVIEIELGEGREGKAESANLSFDGNAFIHFRTGDKIRITKATKTMKLMKLSSVSFLETLRRKMAGN